MKNCNEIQKILADLEFNQVIEDKAVLQHIASCDSCQAYQITCDEMHQAMNQMNDLDADDALVESTLNSILSLQQQTKEPKRLLNTQWASALAASFMLVSLIALFPYNSISNYGLVSDDFSQIQIVSEDEKQAIKKRKAKLNSTKQEVGADYEFIDLEIEETVSRKSRRIPRKPAPPKMIIGQLNANPMTSSSIAPSISDSDRQEKIKQGFKSAMSEGSLNISLEPIADVAFAEETGLDGDSTMALEEENSVPIEKRTKELANEDVRRLKKNDAGKFAHRYSRQKDKDVFDAVDNNISNTGKNDGMSELEEDKVMLDRVVTTGSHIRAVDLDDVKPVFSIDREETKKEQSYIVSMGAISDKSSVFFKGVVATSDIYSKQIADGKLIKAKQKTALGERSVASRDNKLKPQSAGVGVGASQTSARKGGFITKLNPASQYLTEMSSFSNLTYQNASGYWANTYLPGDSSMRLLEANLADNKVMSLSNGISQNIQPFDYPHNAALAVYLNSDVASVDSQQPTRMRLQVGIQASNRQGGQRAAMNIALVFDMRHKDSEYAASMKALLLALLKSKQPGDNISLTVAGVAGGMIIEPKDFRHGQIQVAMNTLFANISDAVKDTEKDSAKDTETLSLIQALQQASLKLQNNDDPSATLGSSVLMLFTANNFSNISEIESMVHKNAVKGITLSTVSLGKNNHQQLKQLALAGQGHSRILQSMNNVSADAKRVIDAELLASSRAVARALRLRIRLAKGVKLIKVIDSYNLNEKQSQRVRDAEQSLDKRLSKNLGIATDRGEDEEGIQIVIPSFFAGDTHVVLLDVVVEKAGAIADVSIRYKDLLYLRNAVSRKQLNIDSANKARGPLQFNVMKNVLASRFAKTIKQAGAHIRNSNNTQALKLLQDMQTLYQSMRAQIPAWKKDTEILQDEKLLGQYITILNAITINDVQKINDIIDSMQYSSWRKQITLTK